MIHATIVGRLGKDPESRQVGSNDVLAFSVAADHGWGDKKTTTWVRVSVWGKMGESLQKILEKGSQVAVRGEIWTNEHDGKVYVECRADAVELLGKPGESKSSGSSQRREEPKRQSSSRPPARREPEYNDDEGPPF